MYIIVKEEPISFKEKEEKQCLLKAGAAVLKMICGGPVFCVYPNPFIKHFTSRMQLIIALRKSVCYTISKKLSELRGIL